MNTDHLTHLNMVKKSGAPAKPTSKSVASKKSANDDDGYKYLIGARGYITEHWRYCDDGVIEGVELLYSDGTSTTCGDCSSKKMSEVISFERDEHIVGIDFEQTDDDGVTHLSLYTSRPEGRSVYFWTNGMGEWGVDDKRAPFIGVYDSIVSHVGKKFTCRRGRRVTVLNLKGTKLSR